MERSSPRRGLQRRDALRLAALLAAAPLTALADTPDGPLQRPAAVSRLAGRSIMLGLATAGARLIAVGERGRILLSDDAGLTWRQAGAVPVSVTLTAVTFFGERLGWATGHSGVVLHTSDAGETWQLQLDGTTAAAQALRQATASPDDAALVRSARQLVADGADKPFLDIDFTSAKNGIAVGAYGLFFATDDGGATWVSRMADADNPKGLHLNAVASVGPKVYIAGERGLLLRSDGGPRYSALAPLYDGSWFAVGGSAEQGVVVAGLRGNAFQSDEDTAWQKLAAGDQTIGAIAQVGSRTLLVTQSNAVRELSQGRTVALDLPPPPAPMTALALAADGTLVATTLRGPVRLATKFAA